MIEQRKQQRFDLKLPIQVLDCSAGSVMAGETQNMSSTGVLLQADGAPPVGEPIEYFITLPKTAGSALEVRLHCFGRVVRQSEDRSFAVTLDRYEFLREPAGGV